MTREEAIEYAESKKMRLEALVYNDDCKYGNYAMYSGELSFVNAALSALRPVSREEVEKVRRGEWTSGDPICPVCEKNKFDGLDADIWADWMPSFCPNCGAPMTDKAVEMVMERMEALYGQENT